ncbi:YcgN family cysteine cluster protein [Jannaschia sp. S6380]|uniref:YcgN family cysteine cluster protein n=1 Tax=Jannaschia sp. S6380 TaxID=2926408 RepID=UPI001FF5677F|nr:YcgN family cysteine cluster protein [Jannaschia sp. S6380]MCK0167581.1 YcgN family cysteine cluster protein [Jannaschia sp. S6380]
MRSDPIDRDGLRDRFWERGLADLTPKEWEALCDGCGKCCLNKLEDEETGEVALTRVACRLFDDGTCRCGRYETRLSFVPECVVLTPATLPDAAYFMPETCAYRRLHEGRRLPHWHPLLTGDPMSPHDAGASLMDETVNEVTIAEDDWEAFLIDEPTGGA